MRKFIKWFNGKKRSIGIIGLSVCSLGLVEKNISIDIVEVAKLLFTILGGVGVAHAEMKKRKLQTKINKNGK